MKGAQHALAAALCLWSLAARAADWDIRRFEGRDYVTLENVANFYDLTSGVQKVANQPEGIRNVKFSLEGARQQVEVTANTREVTINGVKHWLAFPAHREESGTVLVSRLDLAKTFEPALRPQAIGALKPVKMVVLDPGHGGHDKGATNIYGREKDYTLDVCQRAKKKLEARGLKVLMTRTTDVFIPLEKRPRSVNKLTEAIFVSVHFNSSSSNPLASGFEVFSITPRGAPSTDASQLTSRDLRNEPGNAMDTASIALATSIQHAMLGNIPAVDRGVKHQRFAVLRLAQAPAVLVEGGFVSSPSEGRLIAQAAWREKLAGAIVDGIVNYKQLAETKQPPKLLAEYRKGVETSVKLRDDLVPGVPAESESGEN